MNTSHPTPPPIEPILSLVNGELTSKMKWAYRALLIFAIVSVSLLGVLWATEPGPLPPRLHVAFGGLCLIGLGWITVLSWILVRRRCPSAIDRIATAWMATIGCSLSLFVSVPIAAFRGNAFALVAVALTGLLLLGVAIWMLKRAYRLKSFLEQKLESLRTASVSKVSRLIVICLSVASLGFSASRPTVAQEQYLTQDEIQIETRAGLTVTAESGELAVPMDRSVPDGKRIKIAYLRVRGKEGHDSPPTFILAGGPGASGIELVRGMFSDGGERIRKILPGDIIGIDQRGVGESTPNLETDVRYEFSLTEPGNLATYQAQVSKACRRVALELKEQGIDLASFSTTENADDINDVRAALGYKRMQLWGTSYGSHLAVAILRRHGQTVERAMICSPEGPDDTWKHSGHVQNCLNRIAANDLDFLKNMKQVLETLNANPVEADTLHPTTRSAIKIQISDFDIRLMTWHALGRVETTRRLPALYHAMSNNDFRFAASWLVRYRASAGIQSAMKQLMDARSGCSPSRLKQIEAESGNSILGDVINFPTSQLANDWGVKELPAEFRSRLRFERPVLIVCGDWDARTPLENSSELMKGLAKGHLVILNGGGHGFIPHPKLTSIIGSFFRGEQLPREQSVEL